MTNDEQEAKYWLTQLRDECLDRLDEINTALDSLVADDIAEVALRSTGAIETNTKQLKVCLKRLDRPVMEKPATPTFKGTLAPILNDFANQFNKA